MEDKMELGVTVIWDSDEIVKIIEQGEEDIFFYFQAEVGIRDKLVTGVQTCALPISLAPPRGNPPWSHPSRRMSRRRTRPPRQRRWRSALPGSGSGWKPWRHQRSTG